MVYHVSYDIWIHSLYLHFILFLVFHSILESPARFLGCRILRDSYVLKVNKVRIRIFFEKDEASRN